MANAIVPIKERTSRIGAKANGEVQMRDRRIVHRAHDLLIARRPRDRRIVRAGGNTRISAVAVEYVTAEAAACARTAVAVAASEVAAAAEVEAVEVAAVDGAPISD